MANKCKYYKLVRQVSYNNGQTWSNVNPPEYKQGDLYESGSTDCGGTPTPTGTTLYRWTESGTTCVGYDKWQRSIQQYSEDNGVTWHNVNPPVYSATSLIEADSVDCGGTPTGETKISATYSGGITREVVCNDNPILTSGETQPSGYEMSAMTIAVIGDCVTSIGEKAFSGCSSLTSITIPDSVTSIGARAFNWCSALTNIDIPTSVTSIGESAFNYCPSLSSITIPTGITSISSSVFYSCRSLTSIEIPTSVTSIGFSAFYYCTSLTSVTIPDSVTSIEDYAFCNCESLTSITCLSITPPNLVYSSGIETFDYTSNCPIYVPAESVNAYKAANGWNKYASRIQAIP